MISNFTGKHFRFLSNFYLVTIEYEGLTYSSSEAAYQAAKTLDKKIRETFTKFSPGKSKQVGQTLTLRKDWDSVRLQVMEDILRIKFSIPEMKEKLLRTRDNLLVEGNNWNDTFWGVCNGVGENHLGKLLMKIRADLKISE